MVRRTNNRWFLLSHFLSFLRTRPMETGIKTIVERYPSPLPLNLAPYEGWGVDKSDHLRTYNLVLRVDVERHADKQAKVGWNPASSSELFGGIGGGALNG